MTRYTLRTLGGLALEGPNGPLAVDDPIGLGILCLAGLSPDGSITEDEALLRLTPDLTAADGRERLRRATAALAAAAGEPLVSAAAGRLTIDRSRLELDVEVGPDAGGGAGHRFLAGFNLPDSPEFLEWVAGIRPRIRVRPGVAAAVHGPRTRTSIAIGLLGVVALVAVYATRASPPPDFDRGDAIVLADLDNRTGDTLFDRSLITAAAVGLRQSPQFSLLSEGRIQGALRRMTVPRSDSARLTLEVAREVALREGLHYAVGFRLEPAGAGYRLSVEVANAESGAPVVRSEAAAETKAGTIIALDRLLQDVRAGLGERRTERRNRTLRLPEATTPSLEALRSYAMGAAAWSRGSFQVAGELWHRALDLDTGFAMAMGALGSFHYYSHNRIDGERFFQAALARSGRLTEWEQLELAMKHAGYREREDSALVLHRRMIERFPSAASWYNYGTSLMSFGQHEEAIAALEKAAALDSSSANIQINLATSSKALGRGTRALEHYERAGRIDSMILTRGNIGNEYAGLLVGQGRLDDAEQVYRRMLVRNDLFDRVVGYRGIGFVLVRQGRLDEAVGAFRQSIEAAAQQGDRGRLSLMRNSILEALTLLLVGERSGASRSLDRALDAVHSQTEPGFLSLLGYALVRAGRIADAEKVETMIATRADSLNRTDRDARALVAAELLNARGRFDSAAAVVASLEGGRIEGLGRLRRVAMLAAAGQFDRARPLADSVFAAPAFGVEAELEWYRSLVEVAELEARAGDRGRAREGFQLLLDQWPRGDSTAALLVTARQRLAELGRAR